MTENTPATSTDAATGAEGDADQLPEEDTLLDRGVDDLLDEGYSPPDRPRPASAHWGETPWEESRGETLDQRVAQEEPDVWDDPDRAPDPSREPDRAGRLLEDDDAVESGGNDQFAIDAGVSGGAASAEEAAVHVVDEED
ncbi:MULTISPECIES: DUF5709 domain-containing protein [unclassified Cellulomonas]|uniref:DUF5709 domain-containing protein n=1 Tax=unclassified Cellulomonas TaxID=2620175 RepID=UPI0019BB6C09|nr:DUF5709 domain-containing protein [Cellulomonas sp. ES6]MBD3779602.1 hypothetical protein [Micrococcales bacterium]WHP16997.1 DUF5709 domain-containing protein [Cellulomonas sp. ES6]